MWGGIFFEKDVGMPSSQFSGPERPEVDLVQLFRQLWSAKWLVASITGAGLAVAVLYLLLVVPTYEVSVLLRPIQTKALEAVNARDIYALTPREALDRVASLGSIVGL